MTATTFKASRTHFGFTEITSMTGTTDPESLYAGTTITINRINALDIKPGMQIAFFASWHDNGTIQPANVICIREVKDVHVEEKHGHNSRSLSWGMVGARITVDFTDGREDTLTHTEDHPAHAWAVTCA